MRKIKVLLASRPKMLSDVVRNMLERQPDMEVIGEVLDPIELLLTAKARPVDVVIVTPLDSEGEPGICRHLLAEQPRLKIMTLQVNAEAAFLYESGAHKKRIAEPSEESILAAIRESMR
jgi:DNA-binding NarL/FixJ family response regulator